MESVYYQFSNKNRKKIVKIFHKISRLEEKIKKLKKEQENIYIESIVKNE